MDSQFPLWKREQYIEFIRAYGIRYHDAIRAPSAAPDEQTVEFLTAYRPNHPKARKEQDE
jgi:hypothetical protein